MRLARLLLLRPPLSDSTVDHRHRRAPSPCVAVPKSRDVFPTAPPSSAGRHRLSLRRVEARATRVVPIDTQLLLSVWEVVRKINLAGPLRLCVDAPIAHHREIDARAHRLCCNIQNIRRPFSVDNLCPEPVLAKRKCSTHAAPFRLVLLASYLWAAVVLVSAGHRVEVAHRYEKPCR